MSHTIRNSRRRRGDERRGRDDENRRRRCSSSEDEDELVAYTRQPYRGGIVSKVISVDTPYGQGVSQTDHFPGPDECYDGLLGILDDRDQYVAQTRREGRGRRRRRSRSRSCSRSRSRCDRHRFVEDL